MGPRAARAPGLRQPAGGRSTGSISSSCQAPSCCPRSSSSSRRRAALSRRALATSSAWSSTSLRIEASTSRSRFRPRSCAARASNPSASSRRPAASACCSWSERCSASARLLARTSTSPRIAENRTKRRRSAARTWSRSGSWRCLAARRGATAPSSPGGPVLRPVVSDPRKARPPRSGGPGRGSAAARPCRRGWPREAHWRPSVKAHRRAFVSARPWRPSTGGRHRAARRGRRPRAISAPARSARAA
jgi:hypothetical protein